jgi:hypothetical protein
LKFPRKTGGFLGVTAEVGARLSQVLFPAAITASAQAVVKVGLAYQVKKARE